MKMKKLEKNPQKTMKKKEKNSKINIILSHVN
jgi:hypothetical protein